MLLRVGSRLVVAAEAAGPGVLDPPDPPAGMGVKFLFDSERQRKKIVTLVGHLKRTSSTRCKAACVPAETAAGPRPGAA